MLYGILLCICMLVPSKLTEIQAVQDKFLTIYLEMFN